MGFGGAGVIMRQDDILGRYQSGNALAPVLEAVTTGITNLRSLATEYRRALDPLFSKVIFPMFG
jgi:hypothetical protein